MVIVFISACVGGDTGERALEQTTGSSGAAEGEYVKLLAGEAKKIMDGDEPYILLDVRTEDEFNERHIAGAVLLPDTEIAEQAEMKLKDKNATIFVYCRTGNRSEKAARELVKMGFSTVYDLGGIVDWPYEIVTSEPQPSPAPDDYEEAASGIKGEVAISFDYKEQSGHASNQFAVWIEDGAGKFIKTIYATRFTVAGGFKIRPDSIPLWVERASAASLSDEQIDSISGATPKSATLTYIWDLTDEKGEPVKMDGKYKFFIEGSLRWKNRVLYSGDIGLNIGETNLEPSVEYFYENSPGAGALTAASPEHAMISAVKVKASIAKDSPAHYTE
jgi:rhodanese-related sulfurtransferase